MWAAFRDVVGDHPNGCAMILPSKEGCEVPYAVRMFTEGRVIGVDDNPSMLAASLVHGWRRAYPMLPVYGSDIARAAERIAKDGHELSVVNLDLCGTVSAKTLEAVRDFGAAAPWANRGACAITCLKGREDTAVLSALQFAGIQTKDGPPVRLAFLASVLFDKRPYSPVAWGEYKSGRQRMLWAVWEFGREIDGSVAECVQVRKPVAVRARARSTTPITVKVGLRSTTMEVDGQRYWVAPKRGSSNYQFGCTLSTQAALAWARRRKRGSRPQKGDKLRTSLGTADRGLAFKRAEKLARELALSCYLGQWREYVDV